MKLDQTLQDNRLFMVFAIALMTVAKSNRLLQEGGADPEAVKHINTAIELIAKQLDKTAIRMETELQALKSIDDLCRELGILRADHKADNNKKKK